MVLFSPFGLIGGDAISGSPAREGLVPLFHILVLALVQGITEFLPISSSGHLVLVPILIGWPDQGLAIDVAAHLGTLAAVLVYFWRDVARMVAGLALLAAGRRDPGARLALNLVIATLPALPIGYLVQLYANEAFRSLELLALAMVGFGFVLFAGDRMGYAAGKLDKMGAGQALVIGLAQCFAFLPGTSRSGITMVAARLFGYERTEAARFSFLLSIPAILAAAALEGGKMLRAGRLEQLQDMGLTAGISAVAGFLAISFMMRWLRRAGFGIFVAYRLLFGGILLYFVYFHAG
jgi:undecaprenyl-diphosphatase